MLDKPFVWLLMHQPLLAGERMMYLSLQVRKMTSNLARVSHSEALATRLQGFLLCCPAALVEASKTQSAAEKTFQDTTLIKHIGQKRRLPKLLVASHTNHNPISLSRCLSPYAADRYIS